MSLTVAELCWALDKQQYSIPHWVKLWRAAGVAEDRIRVLLNPFRVYQDDGRPIGVSFKEKFGDWSASVRVKKYTTHVGHYPTEAEAIAARYQYIVEHYGPGAIIGQPPEVA